MSGRAVRPFLMVAALLAAPAGVAAQAASVGSISGGVSNASGGAVPGVAVTLESEDRGFSRSVATDALGRFRFPGLPTGRYRVRATHAGFDTVTVTGVLAQTATSTSIAIVLRPSSADGAVTIVAPPPMLDRTNAASTTHLRAELMQHLPTNRDFVPLITTAPGVVGGYAINARGALTGDNQFLFDGANTTDVEAGGFGLRLNLEAIQEIAVTTGGASAAYGGAAGAFVDVITRSGTNNVDGLASYLLSNRAWDAAVTATDEVTGVPLPDSPLDHVNGLANVTAGGPLLRDHAWFFGSYSRLRDVSLVPVGSEAEDAEQRVTSDAVALNVSARLAPAHNVWVRYSRLPYDGFVVDHTGAAAESRALALVDDRMRHWAVQYTGAFGSHVMGDLRVADSSVGLEVEPFDARAGAPHISLANGQWYNGGAIEGDDTRPRRQAAAAVTWFATFGGASHSLSAGFDWQRVRTEEGYVYPGGALYVDESFDPVTRAFVPSYRFDFDAERSVSEGESVAWYVRDAFAVGARLFVDAGLRFETQSAANDAGASTVDTSSLSPRLSATYDVRGDGRTLVAASYGRFSQRLPQNFSGLFATSGRAFRYEYLFWDGSRYVSGGHFDTEPSYVTTTTDVEQPYVDDLTIGVQQQIGPTMAIGARYVWRTWGNLIDDVGSFEDPNVWRFENRADAERRFRALELTFDKRFSNHWTALATYTWSKTEGNQFEHYFSTLGDFPDAECRLVGDSGVGEAGILPCGVVAANQAGSPDYHRPHNLQITGAYSRPVGRVNLSAGIVVVLVSKPAITRTGLAEVLEPGTSTPSPLSAPLIYFYEPRGSDRLDGISEEVALSFETAFRAPGNTQVALRAEIFNVFNNQEQVGSTNTAWCASTETAACVAVRDAYGLGSTPADFLAPRAFQFSAAFRF